jgi:hypothetical protein
LGHRHESLSHVSPWNADSWCHRFSDQPSGLALLGQDPRELFCQNRLARAWHPEELDDHRSDDFASQ